MYLYTDRSGYAYRGGGAGAGEGGEGEGGGGGVCFKKEDPTNDGGGKEFP